MYPAVERYGQGVSFICQTKSHRLTDGHGKNLMPPNRFIGFKTFQTDITCHPNAKYMLSPMITYIRQN